MKKRAIKTVALAAGAVVIPAAAVTTFSSFADSDSPQPIASTVEPKEVSTGSYVLNTTSAGSYNIPYNLKYTVWHTWVRVEGEVGYIGITDCFQDHVGDIVYVDMPNVGDVLNRDEYFCVVESIKTVLDVPMPVSGEIIDINYAIDDTAGLLNTRPYGEGWLIKVRFSDSSQLTDNHMLSRDQYYSFLIEKTGY